MKRTTLSILAVLTAAACGPGPVAPAKPAVPLDQLNQEISVKTVQESMRDFARYRPLCDENGYPLVGNINGKVITTASEFCAAVRADEHKP